MACLTLDRLHRLNNLIIHCERDAARKLPRISVHSKCSVLAIHSRSIGPVSVTSLSRNHECRGTGWFVQHNPSSPYTSRRHSATWSSHCQKASKHTCHRQRKSDHRSKKGLGVGVGRRRGETPLHSYSTAQSSKKPRTAKV